jgi:long-chain acyl-CoA synthetase
VKKRFKDEVAKYNRYFGDYEQIKKYEIVADSWTMEAGFLSPTLKIKRKVLVNNYSLLIDKLFD